MALFRKREKTKTVEPDGAKSAVFSQELQTIIEDCGWGWGSTYALLYRRQPAVRTVVDFLARNIAQLTLKSYLRIDNDDRLELDDHPLSQLMRKPNPSTSRYRFIRDTVADKAIYDRAYWRLDQPVFPRVLIRVPPSRIERRLVGATFEYWGPNGKQIPRNELVVFSGYSPDGNWDNEDGVAPLETLRRVLAEEWAAQENRENYWHNAARHPVAIKRPVDAPVWSDPARERFRTDWENSMTGAQNAGRTAILEEGMDLSAVGAFSPRDSEYIAGRALAFEEVARSYGVAPKLFGMGDIANANIDAFHRQLYQDTFGPWLKELQDDIELQLLPVVDSSDPKTQSRIYVEFNIAAKLQGSFEELARTLTTSVGVPWMAVHEARARVNLPKLDDPDFDAPIKPLNVMYGGQPAVTVPTAVPQPKRRKKGAAPQGALRRRQAAAAAHTELFRRYFRAQKRAVAAKAAAFDMERWNLKLTGELYAARVTLATKTGKLAARQIGGVYNEPQTLNYLQETARRQAEEVNANTQAALDEAENSDVVFDEAIGSRADRLGISTATMIIGFARTEAAKQSSAADGQQRTKTWIVTSQNSRHPELDNETVALNETFSNGALWPGDGGAGADETAGCQCLLQID